MYQKIMSLTTDEIIMLNGLLPVAEESKRLSKLIQITYFFNIGEDKIILRKEKNSEEYITHDGLWVYTENDMNGQVVNEHKFKCTPEGIFLLLRDEYLLKHHFDRKLTTYQSWIPIEKFRSFIADTKNLRRKSKMGR